MNADGFEETIYNEAECLESDTELEIEKEQPQDLKYNINLG